MATYYVNPISGSDDNSGTELAPFATFDKAYVTISVTADTIVLLGNQQYLVERTMSKAFIIKAWEGFYGKPTLIPNYSVISSLIGNSWAYDQSFFNIIFGYSTNYSENSWIYYSYTIPSGARNINFYNCDFIMQDDLGNRGNYNGIYHRGGGTIRPYKVNVYNCTFIGQGGNSYAITSYTDGETTAARYNNIFYNCLRANGTNTNTKNNCFYLCDTNGTTGTDSVLADPLFLDDTYRLDDDSPCIDTGYQWANGTTYPELIPPAKGEVDSYDIGSWAGRYNILYEPTAPPVGANDTINKQELYTFTFSPDDFTYSDPLGYPFGGIIIKSLPSDGILYNDGALAEVNDNVTDVSKLTYITSIYEIGTAYSSFDFKVQSSIGNISATYTMTINVLQDNYFVDENGSDSASGEITSPYATLGKALEVATVSGNIVYVNGDTTSGFTYSILDTAFSVASGVQVIGLYTTDIPVIKVTGDVVLTWVGSVANVQIEVTSGGDTSWVPNEPENVGPWIDNNPELPL